MFNLLEVDLKSGLIHVHIKTGVEMVCVPEINLILPRAHVQ